MRSPKKMPKSSVLNNRILVVDDEPEITDLLKCFLSAKGYKVECALSGEEALGIVDEKRPDLVLLDIRMPGIRGTEVARIIKNRYPSVKIVVITGYADDLKGLSEDGTLTDFFLKPIQLQQLYLKISQVLCRAQIAKVVLWVKVIVLLAIRNVLSQDFEHN